MEAFPYKEKFSRLSHTLVPNNQRKWRERDKIGFWKSKTKKQESTHKTKQSLNVIDSANVLLSGLVQNHIWNIGTFSAWWIKDRYAISCL